MRVVYCGSGEVAAKCLGELANSSHEIAMVFSQPPRRAGRGSHMTATPVADLARSLELELFEEPRINQAHLVDKILSCKPDILVVIDFGQKIGQRLLDGPRFGAINMHASLLPELRGAAPINRAIIQGRRTTGVTTFKLVEKMDAGPILLQHSTEIREGETADCLRLRLSELGSELVLKTLDELAAGGIDSRAQDNSAATFAHKLTKHDGCIDFSASARTIADMVHGCWPWPGAYAGYDHKGGKGPVRVIFRDVRAMGHQSEGTVGQLDENLHIITGDGVLEVRQLKVAGKKLIAWKDFLNGYRAQSGDMFISL